ncbi:MAG TPA: Type 1 glutamine amidotransferase-like domain-containing protein, partial [Ktedonobacterales bacterium]|nr:Type 1 glutamine amidotransferase-like domain-containing protein [Ktedonobacterales bacterium]
MADEQSSTPGAIALVGSGEYTDAMNETDAYLLQTLGGPGSARVALLPTASGLEPGSPARWNAMGQSHFAALGVQDIRSTLVLDAASAADPAVIEPLRGANFYYFSGGNPQHTIETLRGSLAWEIIRSSYEQGAVMAGCSAGAMAMGGQTSGMRFSLVGDKIIWKDALGIAPQTIVFPHFDRMPGFVGAPVIRKMLGAIPKGKIALGIDEDTALVRLTPPDPQTGQARWRVMGRQTVSLFEGVEPARVL